MCTMDGCARRADQSSLITYKFEAGDEGQSNKTYLYTCQPCVVKAPRTFSAHVRYELGSDSGAREVPIHNEAYQEDVNDVRAPTTPPHSSRIPF